MLFWTQQLAIVTQLQLIRSLSLIVAIVIPGHDGQSVKAFIQGLTTAHWKVSSRDISYLEICNSVVDSCTVVIAIHSSFASVIKRLVLKTLPAVLPKPIASYLWEPFNQPEHSLCFGRDNNDFNKDNTAHMTVSAPKQAKTDGASHIAVLYNLHCTGEDTTILAGSSVLSISGLCPPFEACPNRNLFQHFFGIKFAFNGHTYVCSISTFEFVHCFNLIKSIQYRLSHENIVLDRTHQCLRLLLHGSLTMSIPISFFCAIQTARCFCLTNLLRWWLLSRLWLTEWFALVSHLETAGFKLITTKPSNSLSANLCLINF